MEISGSLIDESSVAAALDDELNSPAKLLPEDSVYPAVRAHQTETAEWIHSQLAATRFVPAPEDTVGASKPGHGIRPVAVWDLPSRVAYRALVQRAEARLPELLRSRTSYEQFQRKPLDHTGRYVVGADIAACYQNLDHGLVVEEVAIQTGEHAALDAIAHLLREATGRAYGLPQQSRASDVLAEAFLNRLQRALVRRGLTVERYNDDFRFVCDSWSDVIRTLEVLEEETRLVGLTVNDLKTVTWGRNRYSDQLDLADSLRTEIAEDAELDLTDYDEDEYGQVVAVQKPTSQAVDVLAASRLLDRWAEVAGRRGRVANKNRNKHRAVVQLLPFALSTLASQTETPANVLDRCVQLLRYERTLTPAVATYLASRSDGPALINAADRLLGGRVYLNGWQICWLQRPIVRLSQFAEGAGATRRLTWSRRAFDAAQHSPVLRAEAAQTLARHQQITINELLRVYDRSSTTVRPALAGAIALLKPTSSIRSAITGETTLNKYAYEWWATSP